MACDESYAIINEICELIGIGISFNLSLDLFSWWMLVCPGDAGPCLLLLSLLFWLLLDRKFGFTWDLVKGSLCFIFSKVVIYAYDAQYYQGQGSCKGICVQLC